jgi:hypothetical protein
VAGGSKPQPKFYVGAIVAQPAQAIDMFVHTAAAGNEFVYCEAPSPQYGEGWTRAGELARQGLVRAHERRRQGGGRQWYLVRTTKPLPREQSPQDKVLGDRATAAIFVALKRAANLGQPCPSDAELMRSCGLNSRAQAQWRMRELIRVDLITSTLAYEGGVPTRVVTIVETRHAGTAAAKFTALPKKWAALKQAAERELGAAGGRR